MCFSFALIVSNFSTLLQFEEQEQGNIYFILSLNFLSFLKLNCFSFLAVCCRTTPTTDENQPPPQTSTSKSGVQHSRNVPVSTFFFTSNILFFSDTLLLFIPFVAEKFALSSKWLSSLGWSTENLPTFGCRGAMRSYCFQVYYNNHKTFWGNFNFGSLMCRTQFQSVSSFELNVSYCFTVLYHVKRARKLKSTSSPR